MSHQTQTNFNPQLTSQQNNSDINQALPHYKLGLDPDADMSWDAVDIMGSALLCFCLMSIVAVLGLYLINRLCDMIEVLAREVAKLSRKVVWLEGSQTVAECQDRDSSTPPPGYSVLDENRGPSGQFSMEPPSYPQTPNYSNHPSSFTGVSSTPLPYKQMIQMIHMDTEESGHCHHHQRHQ
eukprot:GFUD01076908.1.p1 GENE.GFUD01076908.1~~GFUD01076908.1.p1  ORF type:complete len:192 (+),score=36.29 GFUD01076908.1:36-578(+)